MIIGVVRDHEGDRHLQHGEDRGPLRWWRAHRQGTQAASHYEVSYKNNCNCSLQNLKWRGRVKSSLKLMFSEVNVCSFEYTAERNFGNILLHLQCYQIFWHIISIFSSWQTIFWWIVKISQDSNFDPGKRCESIKIKRVIVKINETSCMIIQ